MVRMKLRDGEVKRWDGFVSYIEESRVFIVLKSGEQGAKMPAAVYPAESVTAVEGDSGSFQRQQDQPKAIEIRGDSLFEGSTGE